MVGTSVCLLRVSLCPSVGWMHNTLLQGDGGMEWETAQLGSGMCQRQSGPPVCGTMAITGHGQHWVWEPPCPPLPLSGSPHPYLYTVHRKVGVRETLASPRRSWAAPVFPQGPGAAGTISSSEASLACPRPSHATEISPGPVLGPLLLSDIRSDQNTNAAKKCQGRRWFLALEFAR